MKQIMMKRYFRFGLFLIVVAALLAGVLAPTLLTVQAQAKPTFFLEAVVPDSLIYVKALNFPISTTFRVTMGAGGTQGIGGSVVAHFDTTTTAAPIVYTFEVPVILRGSATIDLRAESASGVVVVLTVANRYVSMNTGGSGGAHGVALSLVSVVKGGKVVVNAMNLPAGLDFTAYMNTAGTQGLGGQSVANFNSRSGGSLLETFEIPVSLIDASQIDLRIEATGGYFAFLTFANVSTAFTASGVGGNSSIVIVAVQQDGWVMATFKNMPANVTLIVFIGAAGTQGLGGSPVARFETGAGGTSTHLLEIPVALRGGATLDIRGVAPNYFVTGTFKNVTLP